MTSAILLVLYMGKMARALCGCTEEFVATTPRTEIVGLSLPFQADCFILLDRHATNRVCSHGDHFLEFTILKPQNPVSDILDPLVMRYDDNTTSTCPATFCGVLL